MRRELRNFQLLAAGALAAAALASTATAEIALDSAVVVMDDEDDATVIVSNPGQKRAFVEVTGRRITNPGETPEAALASPDPTVVGLLSSPGRLVLEPGERRSIRIRALGSRESTDQVWRVLVREVPAPEEAEGIAVRMVVAYDVLVIRRPAEAQAKPVVTRNGAALTVRNDGNTFFVLDQGEQCVAEGDCKSVTGRRVYPGKTWSTTLHDSTAEAKFRLLLPGESPQSLVVR